MKFSCMALLKDVSLDFIIFKASKILDFVLIFFSFLFILSSSIFILELSCHFLFY